jgi:hypothetical protein
MMNGCLVRGKYYTLNRGNEESKYSGRKHLIHKTEKTHCWLCNLEVVNDNLCCTTPQQPPATRGQGTRKCERNVEDAYKMCSLYTPFSWNSRNNILAHYIAHDAGMVLYMLVQHVLTKVAQGRQWVASSNPWMTQNQRSLTKSTFGFL